MKFQVKTPRENAYTKVCALRRQSSSISLSNYLCSKKAVPVKRQNHSLDETISHYKVLEIRLNKNQSLDDTALNSSKPGEFTFNF